MTELNDLYYNKDEGICYNGINNASTSCSFVTLGLSNEAKDKIDTALWYLGGGSNGLPYAAYNSERGTTVPTDRPTTWVGIVGLIYPSDYGYAVDLSLCTASLGGYNTDECKNNNWLYYSTSDQWTLSPNSGNAYTVFHVYSTGYVHNNNA